MAFGPGLYSCEREVGLQRAGGGGASRSQRGSLWHRRKAERRREDLCFSLWVLCCLPCCSQDTGPATRAHLSLACFDFPLPGFLGPSLAHCVGLQ